MVQDQKWWRRRELLLRLRLRNRFATSLASLTSPKSRIVRPFVNPEIESFSRFTNQNKTRRRRDFILMVEAEGIEPSSESLRSKGGLRA